MAEALESTRPLPEGIPEEKKPEPAKRPPLKLVPRLEKKEPEEIYANYSTAKAESLFQPGAVFEARRQYGYPIFVVLDFDPKNNRLTVKQQDGNTGMFNKKPETFELDELIQYHHFRGLYKIDINQADWETEKYRTNIPEK